MSDALDPDDLERRMADMRSTLGEDVRGFATQARTLVDWRNHFRAHPWLYCGAAATLGFLLVPKQQRPVSITAAVVPDELGGHRLLVEPRPQPSSAGILTSSLVRMASSYLLREGVTYLKSQLLDHVSTRMTSAAAARQMPASEDQP